jgi:hypothetical protein
MSEHSSLLSYTIEHFQEIARQNRFAENNVIEHDSARCLICHPELVPDHPFVTYLDVVTQSVKVRRPRLDQPLVDELNSDLALVGAASRVTLESLRGRDVEACRIWNDWIRDALSTGLGLLSIHSPSSLDFDLAEQAYDHEEVIMARVEEVMQYQRRDSEVSSGFSGSA